MSRKARISAFGAAGLLVAAGVACAVALGGTVGQVLAFVLIAGGLVAATSLVFLEVGLSEDRELGRQRRGELQRAQPAHGVPRRRRLPRLRGERRHLE